MASCMTCPRDAGGEALLCDECRLSGVALEARDGYQIDPESVTL